MKHFFILISLFFVVACSDKTQELSKQQDWTEEQKRKFFVDSVAGAVGNVPLYNKGIIRFDSFMSKYYPELKAINKNDPFIYALEEPYIDTTKIDTSKHWFRITVAPTFRKPYCVVIEKQNNRSYVTTKVTNGDGGYFTGTLTLQVKFQYKDTLYDNLLQQLNKLQFWTVPFYDSTCGGFDGERWTFESIDNGKYHFANRWSPTACENSTTIKLGQLGIQIRTLSKLEKALTVIEDKKIGI